MSCRVAGCEEKEWMARKFCLRHWKMLPQPLQREIRMMVAARRFKQDPATVQALLDTACAAIAQASEKQNVAAEIGIFRTHMATVHAMVAGIRTVPMAQVRDQLAAWSEALLKTAPALHAERRPHIDRDLAFLDFFANARERLGEIMEAHPVPTKQDPTLVENAPDNDATGVPE